MEINKSHLIESVFAGGGDMGARMRAFDWSTTDLGPVEHWPLSLRACVRIVLGAGHPMLISWGPDYTMIYNDAYGVVVGNKHPGALGRSCRDVLAEAWDFIGPRFDSVYTDGQPISTLTHQMFTFHRKNYLEECYFAFSYSAVPDDSGKIGGVLTNAIDMTERVIEDRRGQVLRDLASRTAEARHEEEVWRASADTFGQNRTSAPFALLYEYRPAEQKGYLASVSVETDDALRPVVIDCQGDGGWPFQRALSEDCLVVALGERGSGLSIPGWLSPPQEATVLPIRLRDRSEAAGFLVLGIHPGRAFDDTYRQFVRRIAEQIAIGLASARAYEQERQRAEALAEIDQAKTAFFSNVSHEFRTPLALMLGPLEEVLPETRERLTPERHEQLVTVRRNAFRLLKLVNTLLDFSRIEAGRVQAVYEPTDLFYRLNVFPIQVPPLRERTDDILMLVEYFVRRYGTRAGKYFSSIDKKTLELLQAYDWPGNIRELQNVIERSVILSSDGVFAVDEPWLPTHSVRRRPQVAASAPSRGEPRDEREISEAALAACRGRVAGPSGAAAKLGVPPSTLDHRIKALSINKAQFKFR